MGVSDWWDDTRDWVYDTRAAVRNLFGGKAEDELPPGAGPGAAIARKATVPLYEGVKAATRIAAGISKDAETLFDWSIGQPFARTFDWVPGVDPGGSMRLEGESLGDYYRRFGRQFYIAQAAQEAIRGRGFGGETDQGFFPGGEAYAESQAAIAENRPIVGSNVFTIGRGFAHPFVAANIIPENGLVYNLISGTVDTAKVLANPFDPFNWIAVGAVEAGIQAGARTALAGPRLTAKKGFVERFVKLEDEVIQLLDPSGALPNPATLSPEDARKVETFTRLLDAPNSPGRTYSKPITSGPAQGRNLDTVEANELYDLWKTAYDENYLAVTSKVGLMPGENVGLIETRYTQWRNSADAYETMTELAAAVRRGDVSVDDLWRSQFHREGYLTAAQLHKVMSDPASTVDDYWTILDEAVMSLSPATRVDVNTLGAGTADRIRGLPYQIKIAAGNKGVTLFEMMPEDLVVRFDDINGSIRNMDQVMTILKYAPEERTEWLTRLAGALEGRNSGALFEWVDEFTEEGFYRVLLDNGIADKEAREVTSWAKRAYAENRGTGVVDDLGNMVPLPWIDGLGYGPLRNTNLLKDGITVADFRVFQQLVDASQIRGRLKNVIKEIPGGEKAVTAEEAFRDFALWYSSRIWKPTRVMSGRHAIRVIPEETLRALASGIFENPAELFAVMANLSLRNDAVGRDLTKTALQLSRMAGKIEDVAARVDELAYWESLVARGQTLPSDEMAQLAELPALRAQLQQLQDEYDNVSPALMDAMLGGRNRAGTGVALGEPTHREHVLYTQGIVQYPHRIENPEGWTRGIAHDLGDISTNAEYRRVASGQLLPDDRLQVDDVWDTIDGHIAAGRVHPYTGQPLANDIHAIKLWLYQGNGRSFFENYWTKVANKAPQYDGGGWDNYQTASQWIDYAQKDLMDSTGGDSRLLDVIITGQVNGERAFKRNASGRFEATPIMRELLDDFRDNAPHAPARVKDWTPRISGGRSELFRPITDKMGAAWEKFVDAYFVGFYGRGSDFIARNPTARAAYWRKMEELLPMLTPDEAQKVLDEARNARLFPARLRRLEESAAAAAGEATAKDATEYANYFAVAWTRNLLYDSNKRSLFGNQHRLMFSFFESQREVTQTWMRLLSLNPRAFRNVAAFRETAIDEGWFYYNDDNRLVFEIPASAAMVKFLTRGQVSPVKNYTVGVDAVNIALQMRPAFGFVVQAFVDRVTPRSSAYDWIREIALPFGSPEYETLRPSELVFPPWVNQISGGVASALEKMPVVGDVAAGATRFVTGDASETRQYQTYYARAMQYLVNNYQDKYSGADGLQLLGEDARDMADGMLAMRGFAAGMGPGAPMTEWLATTQYGQVEVGVLLEDLRDREQAARDRGEPSHVGYGEWIDTWGDMVWVYAASLTQSALGGQIASDEWQAWADGNQGFLSSYPLTGGFAGPDRGEFSLDVYSRQAEADRWIRKDPLDTIRQAQNKWGNYLYYRFRDQFSDEEKKTPIFKQLDADKAQEIRTMLPGWMPPGLQREMRQAGLTSQIDELRRMSNDETVTSSIRPALKEYFDSVDLLVKTAQQAGRDVTSVNWATAKKNKDIRDLIRDTVFPTIRTKYPDSGFVRVYEQVLLYQMIIDEPEE